MARTEPEQDDSKFVSLADEEAVRRVLSSTIMGLWDTVNNLARLRPSKRERYRIALFGSARALPGTFVYEEVKRTAAAATEMGCDIVTGGGQGLRVGVGTLVAAMTVGAQTGHRREDGTLMRDDGASTAGEHGRAHRGSEWHRPTDGGGRATGYRCCTARSHDVRHGDGLPAKTSLSACAASVQRDRS